MIANKPVYKNPIFIILVSVLVLGGVVGIIGLAYNLNKSPTGNDDKIRNLGNRGETEGGTENPLNKGGIGEKTGNENLGNRVEPEGGTENPLNKGVIGEKTGIKVENQSDNISPKIIPDLSISAAQKGLEEFLAENKHLDSLPSFKLLTESGTNEAILQFYQEYLEIRDVKDFKDAKPSNVLKALERYFGSFSTASEADGASFHLKLRQNLASFSLETINAHKILLSLRDSIADSVLLSPHQTAISILLQSLLEPKGCDPHQIFNTLLSSLTLSSGMLPIFSKFNSFLESLLKAEQTRLLFTPWQVSGGEERIKVLTDGIKLCHKWFYLIELVLFSKPVSTLLEGAKKVLFDISKEETKKFIKECFDNQTLDLKWELIISQLKDFYKFDTPENSNYFNCVSRMSSFIREEIFRPETKDAKDEFSKLIEILFNKSDAEFFQHSKDFVKRPSVALLESSELTRMYRVLDGFLELSKFSIKAQFLHSLLGIVRLIRNNLQIVAFVDQLEKLESVPPAELITSIETMCKILPASVPTKQVYPLLILLGKIYNILENDQLENGFLNYWQLLRLQNLLSPEEIVTLINSLPVQVKTDLSAPHNFEEYKRVLSDASLGEITPSSKLYEYLIAKTGITNFKDSQDYWQSLENWIKKPVSDMLTHQMSDGKAELEAKLSERGLKTDLSQLNDTNLFNFLFENNIIGPKLDFSLFNSFIGYLSFPSALAEEGLFSDILACCSASQEIIDLTSTFDLFSMVASFEKAKDPSSGQYDAKILDNLNDNEYAYMLWHTVFKPKISPENPLNREFLQRELYAELERLCTRAIQIRGYERIVAASAPYFDPTDLLKIYYN
jgi:hypothetical protein